MTLLVVICDGETEEGFCKHVLKPHLSLCGYADVRPQKNSKYAYASIRNDVGESLKQFRRSPVVVSTMHDLYKLPKGFPNHDPAKLNKSYPTSYVEMLERAYEADIGDSRFVAYVQLYEFETLLFADVDAFLTMFERADKAVRELKKSVRKFKSIEHIDDGEPTSPSHRIKEFFPRYNKRTHGVEIARRIGLPKLREKCPHFDAWLRRLEAAVEVRHA